MIDELLALPQSDDVWIAGAQPLDLPDSPGITAQTVWLLAVQSRTKHFVLAMDTRKAPPGPQELLWAIVDAITKPKVGDPSRPAAVERGPNLDWGPVVSMLEQIGIEVRPAGTLYDLNTVFQHLSTTMTGKLIPGLPFQAPENK